MKTIICLLLCFITGCTNVQTPSLAVQKNNQAIAIATRNFTNTDSLNQVISLLDEAIAIDPSYKLAYANKTVYLMRLGEKEKALATIMRMEKLCVKDPYYLMGKGMLLEVNDNKLLASENYKQTVSLFEKRLNEKPVEPDLMNYLLALYLRDDKMYSLEEVEQKYPNVFKPETRQHITGMMGNLGKKSREKLIYEMVSGWSEN